MQYCVQDWRALWAAKSLLWVMTRRELASRYAGSAAGVLWAYLQPLLTIAAYWLVFDLVFALRMGSGATAARMGTYLIAGSLPWLAFCDALSKGTSALIDAGSLLQKNALPPVLFVARSVLASWVVFAPLLLLLAFAYIPVSGLHIALLAIPLLVLLQGVLAYLLAHVLAILAAAVRDVVQILGFFLSVGIYLTPVFFPLSLFPPEWRWALFANPMTALVIAYQQVLLRGLWPDANLWAITLGWLLVLGVVLNRLIGRSRDELVDWL